MKPERNAMPLVSRTPALRRRAFTLLEVLVSLAALTAMMTLVWAALSGSSRSWERTERSKARLAELLALDNVADGLFRNAIPFTWPDPESKAEKPFFRGERSSLSIASRRWIGDLAQGGMVFASIELRDGELVAASSKIPFLGTASEPGSYFEETLARQVAGLSFKYAEKMKTGIVWTERWDADSKPNLPLAIQMRVDWFDGTSELWLRRVAGAGLRESFGLRKEPLDVK